MFSTVKQQPQHHYNTPISRSQSLMESYHSDFKRPVTVGSDDLRHLEEESDTLARKANKRLKRLQALHPTAGFLSLVLSWKHKLKDEKINTLLKSLFPKLKTSEEEVRQWLETVGERKELVWNHGNMMLHELDTNIDVYDHHLDFIDEVINDIQQLDYDILKEVNELKVAYQFNQV